MKRTHSSTQDFGFRSTSPQKSGHSLRTLSILGAGLAVLTVAGSAISDVGDDCGGTETPLDAPLHTFCAGNVARAMDVNTNFRAVLALVDSTTADLEAQLDTKLGALIDVQVQIDPAPDAELQSGGGLIVGPTDESNIVIDGNEIMSRNNGTASALFINSSGHDSTTFIQGDAGQVIIGASGSEGRTTLTVRGDLRVTGAVDEECPADMSPLGAWCIDDQMQGDGTQNFGGAIDACDARSASICSLDAIMMCDVQNIDNGTPGSCGAVTDDSASRPLIWTSTSMPISGQSALHRIATYEGDNDAVVLTDGSTAPDGFFCCTFR